MPHGRSGGYQDVPIAHYLKRTTCEGATIRFGSYENDSFRVTSHSEARPAQTDRNAPAASWPFMCPSAAAFLDLIEVGV